MNSIRVSTFKRWSRFYLQAGVIIIVSFFLVNSTKAVSDEFISPSGLDLDSTAEEVRTIINGPGDQKFFGDLNTGFGDFNGDGIADMAFGSDYTVDILLGPLTKSKLSATGELWSSETVQLKCILGFGIDFTSGDMNGDGLMDIFINGGPVLSVILGSSSYSAGSEICTASDLTGSNGFRITGLQYTATNTMSTGGDVNGDGFDDLAIPAFHSESNGHSVIVVYGQETRELAEYSFNDLSELNAMQISWGHELYGRWAEKISIEGDINGDGIDDILIGMPDFGDEGRYVYSIFGSDEFDLDNTIEAMGSEQFVKFYADNPGSGFQMGKQLVTGEDVNGDGVDDVALSYNHQTLKVVYGRQNFESSTMSVDTVSGFQDLSIRRLDTSFTFDGAIEFLDFNGDSVTDIAAVSHACCGGSIRTDKVDVIFGSSSMYQANVNFEYDLFTGFDGLHAFSTIASDLSSEASFGSQLAVIIDDRDKKADSLLINEPFRSNDETFILGRFHILHGVVLNDDRCPPDVENLPTTSNRAETTVDIGTLSHCSDPGPDSCAFDHDCDSIYDLDDNCPYDSNPDQLDTDQDGVGNICDGDLNNDGVVDHLDETILLSSPDDPNADLDGNGWVNFYDLAILESLSD